MKRTNSNYRFRLIKYQIRLSHNSIFYTYFIVDTLSGARYHFFMHNSPEAIVLRNLPISLQNQIALKDICKQIPDMNYFYESVSKYYSNLKDYTYLTSDNSFFYIKEKPKKLTRVH